MVLAIVVRESAFLSLTENFSFQSSIWHDSVAEGDITSRTGPIRASKIGSSQISTIHGNATQSSIPQIDINQQSSFHKSTIKISTTEISPSQISTRQNGAIQIGTTQISPSQIETFQIGSGQISSSQVNITQIFPGNNGVIFGEIDIAAFKPIQIDVASEIDVTQINIGKIPLTSAISLEQLLSSHFSNFHNQYPLKDQSKL